MSSMLLPKFTSVSIRIVGKLDRGAAGAAAESQSTFGTEQAITARASDRDRLWRNFNSLFKVYGDCPLAPQDHARLSER